MIKSNFDLYLETQLQNPEFATRFASAKAAWNKILPTKEQVVFETAEGEEKSLAAEPTSCPAKRP